MSETKEKMTFEEEMNRLEEIVNILEEGNTDSLDNALKLFEEGLTLAKKCEEKLSYYKEKADILIREFEKDA